MAAFTSTQQHFIGMCRQHFIGMCRASVRELAKFHLLKFSYDTMKTNYECQLLYSDTDSLLYEIKSETLYGGIFEKRNILNKLDLSNYSKIHPLYDQKNKMVVLKFKDEFPGDIITEFISLKFKLCSISSRGNHFYLPFFLL